MLSIVIPVLDERELLEKAIPQVLRAASALPVPFEIIIASDGPGCFSAGEMFSMSDSRIIHTHSDIRRGKGGAISDALSIAKGDLFCFFDVDLSTDLKHLSEMVSALSAYDIVIGSRTASGSSVSRSLLRRTASHGYIAYVKHMLGISVSDFQCGFKGFKTAVLKELSASCAERGWAWDTEVLAYAMRSKCSIYELPVIWNAGAGTKLRITDVYRMARAVRRIRGRMNAEK